VTTDVVRELGERNLRLAGLRLWARAREFPDSTDRWDGNWLQTIALCAYPGAEVIVEGPILRTDELQNFAVQCATLHSTLVGEARLDCMEPGLRVLLKGNSHGQIEIEIALTPNHLTQRHEFRDQIDQSYLPGIVGSCREILRRFPIVGIDGHGTETTR
jgi:hypothetical protein